jgi:hypothetical protein
MGWIYECIVKKDMQVVKDIRRLWPAQSDPNHEVESTVANRQSTATCSKVYYWHLV